LLRFVFCLANSNAEHFTSSLYYCVYAACMYVCVCMYFTDHAHIFEVAFYTNSISQVLLDA
jgi:hypothetical protein